MNIHKFSNIKRLMKVTVIIPARNEELTIERIVGVSKRYADRVLVVDGHSIDATAAKARAAGADVILDNGLGKGDAYKVGMKAGGKDGIFVFLDADGSHDPNDIPKLIEPFREDKAEIVVATRLKAGSDDIEASISSFIRNIGGNLLTLLISLRFKVQLTDALNGFRAMKAEVGEWFSENLAANDFDVEHEMIMKALKKKWRIVEVPSHEYARAAGRSKLPTYSKFYKFFWRFIINL